MADSSVGDGEQTAESRFIGLIGTHFISMSLPHQEHTDQIAHLFDSLLEITATGRLRIIRNTASKSLVHLLSAEALDQVGLGAHLKITCLSPEAVNDLRTLRMKRDLEIAEHQELNAP